jgi:quercetin dioxygenase-like cupin family protein
MSNLNELATLPRFDVWGEAVRARRVQGERITLAVVELAPDALVPEHRHEQEQVGIVITGSVTFRIDDETMQFGPGGTWRIPSGHPHEVHAGPEGAVVIDTFNPIRSDWDRFPEEAGHDPVWPKNR